MKVTVEFKNGATVTFHGKEAECIVNYLALSEDDYKPGEAVDICPPEAYAAHPAFLSAEADDPKEDEDGLAQQN